MIRIWLGPEDIARTRIAPAPLPLHEVFVSLSERHGPGEPELARRLHDLCRGLAGDAQPARGPDPQPVRRPDSARHYPEPLAPLPEDRSLEGALERLLTAPYELTAPVGWTGTRKLAHERTLVAAVRAYHDRCVAGELAAGETHVRLDVGERSRVLATGGVEALLGTLDPWAGWHNPVLRVPAGVELDLRPAGTGLLLVPSVLARQLWVGTHPDSIFVAYPVRRPRGPAGRRPVPAYAHPVVGDPLTALLGRSRAAVLRAARPGANTTDLARRANISIPSASQHASVLRDAGLLCTIRHGKAAHHTLTPLARALLTGYDTPARRRP